MSVQEAVDLARSGDTVQLAAGLYLGGVLIAKNGITIRGAGADTVLVPHQASACSARIGDAGICVLGTAGRPVHDVTVANVTVRGFTGSGIAGYFTERLHVSRAIITNPGEYGIALLASTRADISGNWVTHAANRAGLYLGDVGDARDSVVIGNDVGASQIGILVRHARNLTIDANTVTGNCAGIMLVDDRRPGGTGAITVRRNVVKDNNKTCASTDGLPSLQGLGIAVIGGDDDLVEANLVTGNRGGLEYSGGIGLFAGPDLGGRTADNQANHHRIWSNLVADNHPANLIDQSGTATNSFLRNRLAVTSRYESGSQEVTPIVKPRKPGASQPGARPTTQPPGRAKKSADRDAHRVTEPTRARLSVRSQKVRTPASPSREAGRDRHASDDRSASDDRGHGDDRSDSDERGHGDERGHRGDSGVRGHGGNGDSDDEREEDRSNASEQS